MHQTSDVLTHTFEAALTSCGGVGWAFPSVVLVDVPVSQFQIALSFLHFTFLY